MKVIVFTSLMLVIFWQCSQPYQQGQILYETRCANCHMEDGSGLGEAIPSLSPENVESMGADLACMIKHGKMKDGIMVMTAHPSLTETEITNIINYIRKAFGEESTFLKPADVSGALSKCP